MGLDKDKYVQKKSKGRRCMVGVIICSIPCRASCFAMVWFEEKDELHQDDFKKKDEFILFFKIALVQNS